MIQLEGLTYSYPETLAPALRDVSLEIEAGDFVLVAGPSGAGKSTLLRCLNGLVPHFTGGRLSGQIRVAGLNPVVAGPAAMSRHVGFVFQDPEAQLVVDRVEDEVAFALENAAVPRAEMRARVAEALELVGLSDLRDRPVETLSGGEKQRVAIAAALAFRPRVLVLDEPTSQLDPEAAEDVLAALVRLNRQLGLTLVLAEHRLERVLHHCHRLVYVEGPGQPVLSGPPRAIAGALDHPPSLVALGKAFGWEPLPLSVDEARVFAPEILAHRDAAAALRPAATTASHDAAVPCHSETVMGRWPATGDKGAEPLPHPSPRGRGDLPGQRSLESRPPRSSQAPLLALENLEAAYGPTPALRGVDLALVPGEVVALMGPNGSGKTTLLKAIVGLVRPTAGAILLDGASLLHRPTAEICRQVGYLPQLPDDLLFAETVADELTTTLRNHGLERDPPVHPSELLRRLRLDGLADRYPRDLSVGQRQRVAVAAIAVTRPRLLLLDEPTRGMDSRLKAELAALLTEWRADGVAVLLVTHDVELVAQLADRVAVLDAGRLVTIGPPRIVLGADSRYATQVARLFPGSGWLTPADVLSSGRGLDVGRHRQRAEDRV